MKVILLLVCAVLVHVNGQCGCSCGCAKPLPRPLPRPLSPSSSLRSCPAPVIVECPQTYTALAPVEATPVIALPSCNCASVPSLPVSPQILPGIQATPFNLSPCLCLPELGMINPFLPAASPVSALAPTVSSLYPPINPCNCGCTYLKKIPIPPPCI